jgi:hypothetical protein
LAEQPINSKPAFTLDLDYERSLRFDTTAGFRNFFQVRQGRVEGERLRGEVADDGGDWAVLRPDGVLEFESRMMIRAEDGGLVYLRSRGVLRADPGKVEALRADGDVDFAGSYFRTTPYFDTSLGPHDWLTRAIFVGSGRFSTSGARIDIFEVA